MARFFIANYVLIKKSLQNHFIKHKDIFKIIISIIFMHFFPSKLNVLPCEHPMLGFLASVQHTFKYYICSPNNP